MKLKSLLFSLCICLAAIAAADSTDTKPLDQTEPGQTQPGQTQIDQTQIIAWLTAGIPSYRVAQLAQQRALVSPPTQEQLHQFESAGA